MRIAASIVLLALVALPLGACGGSDGGITDSGTATESAPVIQAKWEHSPACDRPAGASRWGCSVGSYRCQSVVSDRGWSTSCSRPGRSIAFTVRP